MKSFFIIKIWRYILSLVLATGLLSYPVQAEQKIDTSVQSVAQGESGFRFIDTPINKSPNDKAVYRAIELDNQMTVVLISDPEANKSLMSAVLPIGSMEDPANQQGLAHYLEHMVFMGSKQYPTPGSLTSFLIRNGGYNNASTAAHRTEYHLQVNNNAFDEAVARLADTLSAPLLSVDYAKKEINAVDSEMIRGKSHDGYLLYSVDLATSNPEHPMTKFTVGNKQTLADKPDSDLQQALENFYHRYYSANLFKVVLYSNQTIEQMATLAAKTLGAMPNKKVSVPSVEVPLYRDQDKGIVIEYKPLKTDKSLQISFDYPNDEAQFKYKTNTYLAYLMSNNAEGTLSDYLIKNGLSDTGVQAGGNYNIGRNRGSFSIFVGLTEKGLQQQDLIISLIFQQIEKIKQEGIQQSYFDEIKHSLQREFRHLQIEKTPQFVTALAENMLYFPLQHIIDEEFVAESMDEEAIKSKLQEMTPANARLIFINDYVVTNKKSPYMEAPYAVADITAAQKKRWLDFSTNPTIQLPEYNPYLTKDYRLIEQTQVRDKPLLIEQRQGTRIYAMPSRYFRQDPKVDMLLTFTIMPKQDSLKQTLATEALEYMNELAQSKLAFQAAVAGMQARLNLYRNGLTVNVSGYTRHLARLAEDTLQRFGRFELREKDLQQAKQRMHEILDRAGKDNSLSQANAAFARFSRYPYFNEEKQRKEIDQLTLSDVEQVRHRLLTQSTGLSVLSVGNFSDQQVRELVEKLNETITYKDTEIGQGRYVDISGVTRKVNKIIKVPNEDNAFSILFIPQGYGEMEGKVRAALLDNIISRWYFDELRTERQLGYVVSASSYQIGKLSGIRFMVQSPNNTPAQIMQNNTQFFTDSAKRLAALSDTEFNEYRNSFLEVLRRKPESLGQEFSRYMEDFNRGNNEFDHLEKMIGVLEKTTKRDVEEFFLKAVIERNGFVFASQALGVNSTEKDAAQLAGFETIDDIEALQRQFPIKQW